MGKEIVRMRYKKILFVYPNYRSTTFTMPVVPVGLGYLAEYLKQHEIEYRVIDMRLDHTLEDLWILLNDFNPDIIGISLMSFMYKDHYGLIGEIKSRFKDIPIVAGGPHISTFGKKALEECSDIDYGILQEGEVALLALCQGKDLNGIDGLIFRSKDKVLPDIIKYGPEQSLDILPFPRYEHFELEKYGYGISIASSRGCPFACIFCTASVTRKKFRARNPKDIINEMLYWYKRGYREFDLQEDNPTFSKSRILEFCDKLAALKLENITIMCGNGVRSDKVDREILTRMKAVGFKRLGFGVEAGNDKVLRRIKKGETIEVIKKAIQEACDLGFFVSLFFTVGSPEETLADFQDSVDIALNFPIAHVNFFNLIPLPSTELYQWVEENKYFLIDPVDYLNSGSSIQMNCVPVFATPYFTKAERIMALKTGKKVERIVKRRTMIKTLHRFFPLNYAVAWLYVFSPVQYIENQLLRFTWYRILLTNLRNKIRGLFYK